MTLQQLKYVITIAKYNSMNQAAKELFVSQPNMSETVKTKSFYLMQDKSWNNTHYLSIDILINR